MVLKLQTRVTFDPLGVTRPTAYAREAIDEPVDVANQGLPDWIHFRGQKIPFSARSALFLRAACIGCRNHRKRGSRSKSFQVDDGGKHRTISLSENEKNLRAKNNEKEKAN